MLEIVYSGLRRRLGHGRSHHWEELISTGEAATKELRRRRTEFRMRSIILHLEALERRIDIKPKKGS